VSFRPFFLRFLWSFVTPPYFWLKNFDYNLISISTPDGKSKRVSKSTVCAVGFKISIRRLCVRISNCSRESLYLCTHARPYRYLLSWKWDWTRYFSTWSFCCFNNFLSRKGLEFCGHTLLNEYEFSSLPLLSLLFAYIHIDLLRGKTWLPRHGKAAGCVNNLPHHCTILHGYACSVFFINLYDKNPQLSELYTFPQKISSHKAIKF